MYHSLRDISLNSGKKLIFTKNAPMVINDGSRDYHSRSTILCVYTMLIYHILLEVLVADEDADG